jgi:MoaA/NifB/PqqE/SkfB family radical SAM enzyme
MERSAPAGTALAVKYGFHDRLKAAFPSQVIVDATEICNLACIHCPHPEFKKSDQYSGRHLDLGLHHKMVDEVRDHGAGCTQYIRYTSNGEPLVHPQIYDMLDYAVRCSGVFVTLTTNGTILNEKRVEKLLASGLHLIDVSIDAFTPETYAKVRVNGRLEVTRGNVLRLLEIKRRAQATTRVIVSFVEQPLNTHEAAAFEAYWKDQGADYVVMRRLHSAASGVPQIAALMQAEQAGETRYPCLYPWERILLNPRGDLAFCPQDWVHGSVIADYHNTTIREVWQSEEYRKLREAHLRNNFAHHQFCGRCPDWRQTRWPGEGRSYADMVQEFSESL